jgi:hypothetical protein
MKKLGTPEQTLSNPHIPNTADEPVLGLLIVK